MCVKVVVIATIDFPSDYQAYLNRQNITHPNTAMPIGCVGKDSPRGDQ